MLVFKNSQPLTSETTLLQRALKQDVEIMAGQIGSRNFQHYDNLNATKDFIERVVMGLMGMIAELAE